MKNKMVLLGLGVFLTGSAVLANNFTIGGIHGLNFVAPTVAGKANVYAPQTGEIIYDSSDSTFYGYNQAGSWIDLSGGGGSALPAGTILPYGGTSAPTGYLIADGSAVSRTTYATLFAAVGTAFGNGDGSTTFNLPDFRGRFLRGVDGSAGRDPDSSTRTAMNGGGNISNNIGSVQTDQFAAHVHGQQIPAAPSGGSEYVYNSSSGFTGSGISTSGMNTNTTGGNETRPVNAYVNYMIKY